MTDSRKPFDMSGQVAVVTGSLGMLGREHCKALAGAGASLVCMDLDEAAAVAQAEELTKEFSVPALGLGCDISVEAQGVASVQRVLDRFGRVDALVNNARWPYTRADLQRSGELSLAVLRADYAVQVEGAFVLCREFGKPMRAARRGSIVNISSIYGFLGPDQRIYEKEGIPTGTPISYSINKAALTGLTHHLAAEWGADNVRVNLLTPGGIRAEGRQSETFLAAYHAKVPLGRMAWPAEMAGALVFLCSDASSYVTGTNILVDGGFSVW
jgi:NAD(P)-dependent dehydrogenase (short-subunit alcohol dehydrogenase family)